MRMTASVLHPVAEPPRVTQAIDTVTRVADRPIGHFIQQARRLGDHQIEQILAYQREHGVRFGQAAVALELASGDDVVWALSQQFHYPHALADRLEQSELVVATQPFGREAEAFRELRSQLMMGVLNTERHRRRALAVISPERGDGKTYVAANLAVAFSQLSGRTVLVDADMRTPRQQSVFAFDSMQGGLSAVLCGRSDRNVVQRIPELPSLSVLPVGSVPPNPLELLHSPAFGVLIEDLLSKFDHVIVDTPAAAHGADARVIAAHCGAVIAIGRKGKSRMQAMNALLRSVAQGPARLAGVVMNEY